MKKILLLCTAMVSLSVVHAMQRLGSLFRNPEVIQAARMGAQSSMRPASRGMATEVKGIQTISVEAGQGSSMSTTTQPVTWFERFRTTVESPVNYVKSFFERRAQRAMDGARMEEGKFFEEQKKLFYESEKAAYGRAKLDVGNPDPSKLRRATESYLGTVENLGNAIESWRGISERMAQRPFLSAEERVRGKAYHDITEGFSKELALQKVELESELSDLKRREQEFDFTKAYKEELSHIQSLESILPTFDEKLLSTNSPYGYQLLESARDQRKKDLDSMKEIMSRFHQNGFSVGTARAKAWNEKRAEILKKYEQEQEKLRL